MSDFASLGARVVDGAAAWLLTYAIHGTILLTLAWLASRARVGEHVRETLWKMALAGALLTATYAQVRPSAPAIRFAPAAREVGMMAPARAPVAAAERSAPAASSTSTAAAMSSNGGAIPWTTVIVLAWVAGAAVALARLGAGWMRFTRGLARVPASADEPATRVLRELCGAAGVRRPIRLTVSERASTPVALPGREICIPRQMAARLDGPQLRAMLAHETAHVLRGDPQWLWAASVIAAVFWFQPLLRVCLRGLRNAAEYQCDAWAAGHAGALALARCLADVASWGTAPRATPAPVAAMAAGGGALLGRVERLLHGPREPRARRRWVVAGVTALALAAAYAPAVSAGAAAQRAGAAQTSFAARFHITSLLAAAIERAAAGEGVDAELAFRLVHTESRFDERKVGPGGIGLTQIILPTARRLQPGITRDELLRRDTNLRLGLRYLHTMLVRYDGDVTRAVQAYYEGPRGLEHDGPAAGTRAYADQLLAPVAGLPAYRGPGLRAAASRGAAR